MQSVGVVIPMYNRRDLICRCLDSVKAQTWRRLEVVVVDNNSTDDSVAVVRDWCERHQVTADTPDFRFKLLSESKPGAAAARNKGLEAITSEHILFFDCLKNLVKLEVSLFLLVEFAQRRTPACLEMVADNTFQS